MTNAVNSSWPVLDYERWLPTYQTLHRITQIVGKLRLCNSPWVNHSWSATLYVSARGLTTGSVSFGDRIFTAELDFIDHVLNILTSDGHKRVVEIKNEPVAAFFVRFKRAIDELGIAANFDPRPNETPDAIPFAKDVLHRTYDRSQAYACWQALVRISHIFEEFRADFIGKSSPVHFFWGSFDLAVTRFSGRHAPEQPGGVANLSDAVARDAYSHEVSSCGFWPGNEIFREAAFYSYAYPAPKGYADFHVEPSSAFFHRELGEFLLPYDAIRRSENPQRDLALFLKSTYEAAATLASWNRESFERSPYLYALQHTFGHHPFCEKSPANSLA
jgi:hypothetical protein